MVKNEFTYPSHDGKTPIHAVIWRPEGEVRAVLQISHGVAEYALRYEPFAAFLTEHGFAVAANDHIGHGQSLAEGAPRLYFGPKGSWQTVVDDLYTLRCHCGKEFPGVPYALLGHSMGSFLTRTYLIDHPGTVDGAILSGTGQEPAPLVAFGKLLAGLECRRLGYDGVSPLVDRLSLGAYNRRFRPNRTSADWLSRDEEQVDAYLADPLCSHKSSVSMFRDMMGGLQYIARRENLARMDPDTPVYFFSGDQDPVGGMGKGVRKVYAMFQAAGCRDVTLKLYPGGRHEMFNELDRQQVFDDLLAWLEAHMPREGRA